jgi:hypothetical protein
VRLQRNCVTKLIALDYVIVVSARHGEWQNGMSLIVRLETFPGAQGVIYLIIQSDFNKSAHKHEISHIQNT